MQLANGSRVVVVGGGPAGSFTALHLLRLARKARLDIEVMIYEGRDFDRPGPSGCNKCAGILSSTLLSNLAAFGLQLPAQIIQAKLDTYTLHLGNIQLPIHPPDPSRQIVSVYRGSGPRKGTRPYPPSFDGWLLNQARRHGAVIKHSRVQSIKPGPRPVIVTAEGRLEADLVVVAVGINSHNPLDPVWGYRPPLLEVMAQDEILLSNEKLGGSVHIFFNEPRELLFGGVIPKGRYANISLLGKNLPPDSVDQFLDSHEVVPLLTRTPSILCSCTPRVAISSAVGYYGDRMVVVGDAAVTRLYKDGIGAAFTTARAAARTAIHKGISRQDFHNSYHPVCRSIAVDNRYGRWLFRLWAYSRRSPFLLNAWKQAILTDTSLPAPRRVHERVLWGIFTGEESYSRILWILMSLPTMRGFWSGLIRTWRKR